MSGKSNGKLKIMSIAMGACALYAVSAGLRSIYGVMVGAISAETGIAYGAVSFAIAIGQLVFGVSQPIFGVVALKKSKRFVLMLGSFLMALGLALIPFCSASWMLNLAMGVVLATGTGAVSFGMIMGAVTPVLGDEKAVAVSGMVNASSGIGGVVFSPLLQSGFDTLGLKTTLLIFAAIVMLLVPVSRVVSGEEEKTVDGGKNTSIVPLLKKAFKNRSYWCLLIGFFTCGYHMATIETHLFSQIVSYGISEALAAVFFSIYGAATMIGSLFSGFLCEKIPMKYVVTFLYGSRVAWVAILLWMPKSEWSVLAVMILLGLTGAATLTPTSGITSKLFGAENLATLFGVVFLSHQLGSFFSSWIGGRCVEMTGDYVVVWVIAMALSAVAAVASYMIKEKAA